MEEESKEFDYCEQSPTKQHSEEWYCNADCAYCKTGEVNEKLMHVYADGSFEIK